MFELILLNQGIYFAIAFLYDSGYTTDDLKNMMTVMERQAIKENNKSLISPLLKK